MALVTLAMLTVTQAPAQTLTLTSESASEYFEPITSWISSADAMEVVQGYVFMIEQSGTFRARLGIQTANDQSLPGPATYIGSQNTAVTTAGLSNGILYRFNPNAANDGNVDGSAMFRLGILYSVASGGSGGGVVKVNNLTWR